MNLYLVGHNGAFPDTFESETVSAIFDTHFEAGRLSLERNSEFFPQRSDEKIMRVDIKSAIISIQNLIKETGLTAEDLNSSDIYVANGAFIEDIEKFYSKLTNVYKNLAPDTTEEQKFHKLYRASPPLVAVETLTNSSMSFISQYAGIKGRNTTFGTTSISAFYALKETLNSLTNKDTKYVFVCSANCGGSYSALSNTSTIGYKESWKEGAAVANLIFSNDAKENAICEVTHLKSSTSIPNFETRPINRNWKSLIPDNTADLLIFSGAFDNETFEEDKYYCSSLNDNTVSLFPDYGNMGASNILMGILHGTAKFSSNLRIIDVVDRDLYGRESLVRIKKC